MCCCRCLHRSAVGRGTPQSRSLDVYCNRLDPRPLFVEHAPADASHACGCVFGLPLISVASLGSISRLILFPLKSGSVNLNKKQLA
jgi:hypothetical protein